MAVVLALKLESQGKYFLRRFWFSFSILFIVLFLAINCPNGQDYWPCVCFGYNKLSCSVHSTIVVALFEKNPAANLDILFLQSQPRTDLVIPANLMGNHTVNFLELQCSRVTNEAKSKLIIDQAAFYTSRHYIRQISIQECDLSNLNFIFLLEFNHLFDLIIEKATNIGLAGWSNMPSLPELSGLKITAEKSADWKGWIDNLPNMLKTLLVVQLDGTRFGDEETDRVMNWLANSTLLQSFQMLDTSLTRIPSQISTFKSLFNLKLSCEQSIIDEVSLKNAPNSLNFVEIENCRVRRIEPGTLHGILINKTLCALQ